MRLQLGLAVLGLSIFASGWLVAGEDQEWNQWRGPNRDGRYVGNGSFPESLDEAKMKLVWRKELGPSYSGPIVQGETLYTTETIDKKLERVTAFNRKTGEKIWSRDWEGAMEVPFFAKANGDWIRATPVVDGESLYVAGIRDVLVCLNSATGEEKWRFDFVKEVGSSLPSFGCASSPLVVGDFLYVQAGGGLMKLNKSNGAVVWSSLRDGGGMDGSAFSSPIYTKLQGVEQLVVQTRTTLTGVNPEDGQQLWQVDIPAFRGMNIVTPTIIGDQVFTSSYGGKSFLYGIKKQGDQWSLEKVWENRQQGYMSSPVVIENNIYLHLRNQRFTSINLENGESNWTSTPYGKYWSMVIQGDRILALDQDGQLRLIEASPERLKIVSERKVSDDAWAHLAVDNGQIIIRELNAVSVYSWE